jgi:hypothetical protein
MPQVVDESCRTAELDAAILEECTDHRQVAVDATNRNRLLEGHLLCYSQRRHSPLLTEHNTTKVCNYNDRMVNGPIATETNSFQVDFINKFLCRILLSACIPSKIQQYSQ